MHFTQHVQHHGLCIVCVAEHHGIDVFYINFNNLQYSVWKIHVILVFTSNFLCLYSSCPVDLLITECVISMAAVSKTDMKHKLLSVQEKLDIVNVVDAT
jgi:hypothetical protein